MIGAATAAPVPVSTVLNRPFVGSLLAMCSAAICTPALVGAKFTIKLVLPPGLTVTVRLVTAKLAAFVPSMVMPEMMRLAEPVFVMVKARLVWVPTTTEPKLLGGALLRGLVSGGGCPLMIL